MHYCKNCKSVLEDYEIIRTRNTVPFGLGEITESYETECTKCGSNQVIRNADIVECDYCGALIPIEMSYKFNNLTACEECFFKEDEENEEQQ